MIQLINCLFFAHGRRGMVILKLSAADLQTLHAGSRTPEHGFLESHVLQPAAAISVHPVFQFNKSVKRGFFARASPAFFLFHMALHEFPIRLVLNILFEAAHKQALDVL